MYCPRECDKVAHTLAAKGALMAGVPDVVTDGLDPSMSVLVAAIWLRTLFNALHLIPKKVQEVRDPSLIACRRTV